MGQFTVTPQTLRDKADQLHSLNSQYKAALETLQSQEGTLQGQWEGQARDTFHREFTKDVSRLMQFYSAVEDYSQKLRQIAQQYADAEKKNLSTASARNS